MKRLLLLAAGCLLLAWSVTSLNAEPPLLPRSIPGTYAAGRHHHCPTLTGCPDDYHRPPCPVIRRFCGCEPNDYCRPPCPKIHKFCGCEPNDYCRKACPTLCCPPCLDSYSCGVPACNSGR